MTGYRDLLSPPNLASLLRLLMAPVLFWLAIENHPRLFLLAVVFTIFTDLLDGFLARALNQITPLGSALDSWGDFTVYTTLAICAWILWPDTVLENRYSSIAIILSFTLPSLIGLIKFRGLTSYHTWSVKLAAGVTIIGYLLLFGGIAKWPFHTAAVLCLVAAAEEIAITIMLKEKRADIRTIWQVENKKAANRN